MNNTNSKVNVFCHCKSIQMELSLSKKIDYIIICNCSICSKTKGSGMICVPIEDLIITKGKESITEYLFNSMGHPHIFCIICGTHTHHRSRSSPEKFCINIACIEGFNFNDYKKIVNFDGINHPKDKIILE